MKAEGREYGERILDCELRLKAYFDSLPKATGGDRRSDTFKSCTGATFEKPSKQEAAADMGFDKYEAHRISQLTPEAVEKAKAVARENNDIPTRSLALQIAKQERKEAQIAAAKQSVIEQTRSEAEPAPPVVRLMDCADFIAQCKPYDLLLTDPP